MRFPSELTCSTPPLLDDLIEMEDDRFKQYFGAFKTPFSFISHEKLKEALLDSGLFKGEVPVVKMTSKQSRESFFHRIKRYMPNNPCS